MISPLGRRSFLGMGSAGLSGLLGGCVGENPFDVDEAPGWNVRLGILAPESGAFERYGRDMTDCLSLLGAQLEAADTDFGLDYQLIDTETDPETAVAGAQTLIEDEGFEILIGPYLEECVVAVLDDVSLDAEVPLISPLAGAGMQERRTLDDDDETGIGFSLAPDAVHIGQGFNRLADMNRWDSIAVIHTDGIYGTRLTDEALGEFELRGIDTSVVIEVPEAAEEIDVTGILDEVDEASVDGLALASNRAQAEELLSEYLGEYDPVPMLMHDRLRDPELSEVVGADLDDAWAIGISQLHEQRGIEELEEAVEEAEEEEDVEGTITWEHRGEDVQFDPLGAFHNAFPELTGREPSVTVAQTFDALIIGMLAVVQAGEALYEGRHIAGAVERVAAAPAGMTEDVGRYGVTDWYAGIGEIGGGITNDYLGASGDVSFNDSRGTRSEPVLNAVTWDEEAVGGFRETHPIPL